MATNETQIPNTFTEAPASFNVKCYSPDGYDIMLTLRGQDSGKLMHRASVALKWLKENGFSPARPRNEPSSPQQPEDDPIVREAELNDYPSPLQNPQPTDEFTFEAEELAANVNGGKTYWKVKGGRFSQYGVTVWPEVLNEAIRNGLILGDEELDPMQTYQLFGLVAYYVENDKGKPQKVTRLEKVPRLAKAR